MKTKKWYGSMFSCAILAFVLVLSSQANSCDQAVESDSGVTKATTKVQTGSDGLTVEQNNVQHRLKMDNTPGSIKHLYVISAFSGQVILYSTVKGKVTSSGKRLNPSTVVVGASGDYRRNGFDAVGGNVTSEVLEDDGTYGSSAEYIYWWDVQGRYHQHYISGGQIVHISDQPIPVKSITINMEQENAK